MFSLVHVIHRLWCQKLHTEQSSSVSGSPALNARDKIQRLCRKYCCLIHYQHGHSYSWRLEPLTQEQEILISTHSWVCRCLDSHCPCTRRVLFFSAGLASSAFSHGVESLCSQKKIHLDRGKNLRMEKCNQMVMALVWDWALGIVSGADLYFCSWQSSIYSKKF